MRQVNVSYAAGGKPFTITADKEFDALFFDSPTWRKELLHLYDADAQRLFSALQQGLPGGTLCALLRMMLEHRASLLRVAEREGNIH